MTIQLPQDIWNKINLYNSHPCADIVRPLIDACNDIVQTDYRQLKRLNYRFKDTNDKVPKTKLSRMTRLKISEIYQHDRLFVRTNTRHIGPSYDVHD
jgi:hypothetical protein